MKKGSIELFIKSPENRGNVDRNTDGRMDASSKSVAVSKDKVGKG